MFYYAQLNDDNLVVSVSTLSTEIVSDKLIPLETNDVILVGMIYDRDSNKFIEAPLIEEVPPKEEVPLSIQVEELKIKIQKTEEITSNISVFQQELLELLIETGVL